MGSVSTIWQLSDDSLRNIQRVLLEYYGLPTHVIDTNFVNLTPRDRSRVARRRQRSNRSWPLGDRVCKVCGSTTNLERHHLVPPNLGGRNVRENLVWLCSQCHAEHHGEVLYATSI